MKHALALSPETLYHRLDADLWTFRTTEELQDLTDVIGQARATEAIRFGINIRRDGYNLFVLESSGTGGHIVVQGILGEQAAREPIPSDWCYVNNFEHPHQPRALRLPAGLGAKLRGDMEDLVEELEAAIPGAFESEEYRGRRHEIEQADKEHHEKVFGELGKDAAEQGIAFLQTPTGMAFAPMREKQILSPEDFSKLPEEEQKRIEGLVQKYRERLERIVEQIPQWRRENQAHIRELDRDVVMAAVGDRIRSLKHRYEAHPQVLDYLSAVEQAVITNADDFRRDEDGQEAVLPGIQLPRSRDGGSLHRYEVNLLIDNGATRGAPVVYLDNPSHAELIGRVEHLAHMGSLVTDFTLIKPGALHRANGGYLMLDARQVLQQPFAWEGLKRCLSSSEIRIGSLAQELSLISTVSLEPEAIPLQIKIIVLGERWVYYLLYNADPDFRRLFKVAADFNEDMDRDAASELNYARLVASVVRREKLLPFDRRAVARVLEQGSRSASHARKLSIRMQDVTDLLREADYWAHEAKRDTVLYEDVQRAIDARIFRSDRVRERIQEEVRRGTIIIGTAGNQVGQVNALTVMTLGHLDFGHPVRITVRVRLGKGEVVDIQREVKLGGPIHSKGVMILAGFLGARYCASRPMSLSASIVFEQTYGEVEGDSASCAELCALLSALAEVPIRQSLAMTGSVNQHGEVQAIGGVNEKIEGFFDICSARGLTGDQGVIIPASNVGDLMLRADIVQACRDDKFQVYAATSVDEAIELLTGTAAGVADSGGAYPEASLNQRVEQRLVKLADQVRAFSAASSSDKGPQ